METPCRKGHARINGSDSDRWRRLRGKMQKPGLGECQSLEGTSIDCTQNAFARFHLRSGIGVNRAVREESHRALVLVCIVRIRSLLCRCVRTRAVLMMIRALLVQRMVKCR